MRGLAVRPTSRRPGEGERLTPDAPHSNWGTRCPQAHVLDTERSPGSNAGDQLAEEYDAEPTSGSPTRTPPHQEHMQQNRPPQAQKSHRRSAPHPLPSSQAQQHSNDGANSPTQNAPPISDAGRGTRGHQGAETPRQRRPPPPPTENTDTDSDLEMVPEALAGSAPAMPASLAGSMQALCPAWKRSHLTREGWCPGQHSRPAADDRALPEVGHAAARAALRYGVAQGLIQDETSRGSVNIQEAAYPVAHTGQTEGAMQGRTGDGDSGAAHGDGTSPGGGHGPWGAPLILSTARASAVDRPGFHPTTGVAFLHMGSACCHVAPGTGGHSHGHRGGNGPGPPHLAGRPVLPLAQAPRRPPGGACGKRVQPRGNPPVTPRQEGAPLPADRYGPGRPARLMMHVGHGGGATTAGPLDPPTMVLARRRPGPCHASSQRDLPAAREPRRSRAPQPAGGGVLSTVARRERTCGPVLPPVAGTGIASRRGHLDRGMGGDRARHGVQMDNGCRSAIHAANTGVPTPSMSFPPFDPLPGPHTGRLEGPT